MTICPHCKNNIAAFNIDTLNGYAHGNVWKVVSYNCPSCHVSLGAQIDPIAIKTDTINELKRRL